MVALVVCAAQVDNALGQDADAEPLQIVVMKGAWNTNPNASSGWRIIEISGANGTAESAGRSPFDGTRFQLSADYTVNDVESIVVEGVTYLWTSRTFGGFTASGGFRDTYNVYIDASTIDSSYFSSGLATVPFVFDDGTAATYRIDTVTVWTYFADEPDDSGVGGGGGGSGGSGGSSDIADLLEHGLFINGSEAAGGAAPALWQFLHPSGDWADSSGRNFGRTWLGAVDDLEAIKDALVDGGGDDPEPLPEVEPPEQSEFLQDTTLQDEGLPEEFPEVVGEWDLDFELPAPEPPVWAFSLPWSNGSWSLTFDLSWWVQSPISALARTLLTAWASLQAIWRPIEELRRR